MKTSGAGIRFIQSFEKCSLTPYKDQGDKWTIGFGHLMGSSDNMDPITKDQADDLFLHDLLARAETPVNNSVHVILSQNQFDALVSLCFNIGSGNFTTSSLLRALNSGDIRGAAGQFQRWDKVRDAEGALVESDGLIDRRKKEQNIFVNAIYENHQ